MPTKPKKFKGRMRQDGPTGYYFEEEVKNPGGYVGSSLYDEALSLEEERVYELGALEPAKQLEWVKGEILVRLKITKNEIFKIGELLWMAKRICQQEGMKFQEWIRENCDFSYETANNFMNVFKYCFGMRDVALKISSSILYKISAPGFPEELRDYLFEQGQLEEMTNGRLRELTKRYKEGGFEAIEDDIQELHRGHLVYRQTCFTLDMCENALRTLEGLQQKIKQRGRGRAYSIPIEDQIKSDEPEAFGVNMELSSALQTGIDALEKATRESHYTLGQYWGKIQQQCGMVGPDGRWKRKKDEEFEKELEERVA